MEMIESSVRGLTNEVKPLGDTCQTPMGIQRAVKRSFAAFQQFYLG
jgi:hypothetical protein